jgi:hypothetical protein
MSPKTEKKMISIYFYNGTDCATYSEKIYVNWTELDGNNMKMVYRF